MSTLNDTDLFVYQEAATGNTGAVAASNRSTLEDDDLFVVYRPTDGLNYKVKAEDVGMGSKNPPEISSVTLTQDQFNENRFTNNAFTTTVLATNTPESLALRAEVTGALAIEAGTDLITNNGYVGSTSIPLTLNSDANLGDGVFEIGDTVAANESYTPTTGRITDSSPASGPDVGLYTGYNDPGPLNIDSADPTSYLRVFDGSTSSGIRYNGWNESSNYDNPNQGITWNFDGSRVVSKVEVLCSGDLNAPIVWLNQANKTNTSTTKGWHTVYDGAPTTLDSLSANAFGTGTTARIFAFRFDDEITEDTTTLTLENDNDIHLFQKGDEVQSGVFVQATDVAAKTIAVEGEFQFDNSNESEVWIDGVFADQAFESNSFDGGPNAVAFVVPGYAGTMTFSPPAEIPIVSSIQVQSHPYSSTVGAAAYTATLDGVTVNLGGISGWISIPEFVGKTISSATPITFTHDGSGGNRCYVPQIMVDGMILVDAGRVDYVNTGTIVNPATGSIGEGHPAYNPVNAYDGSDNTSWGTSAVLKSHTGLNIPFSTLQIQAECNTDSVTADITLYGANGSEKTIAITEWYADQNLPIDCLLLGTGTLESPLTGYSFYTENSASGLYIKRIIVDGESLINQTKYVTGDTNVSTLTAKRGSGTISGITGTQVTITPFTDNCFKEGQYLIHSTPKPIVIEPVSDVISDYDKSAKNITLSGPGSLLDFQVGDEVFMADADGNPVTVDVETDGVVSKVITSSDVTLKFSSTKDFNFLYPTDVIKSDRLYTPDSGAISGITTGSTNYVVATNTTPIDLSGYDPDAEMSVLLFEPGARGTNGADPNRDNGGGGGTGGNQGFVYYRSAPVSDFGGTFIPNDSNNFQGIQVDLATAYGKGGPGAGGGQGGWEGRPTKGTDGTSNTIDWSEVTSKFKGLVLTAGDGGIAGNSGTDGYRAGGGGGGGGGGGVIITIDNGEYDGDNSINIPTAPNANGGGGGGHPSPESANRPGQGGQGGKGWGSGGGGGGGSAGVGDNESAGGGQGGNGAAGITFVRIAAPTVLNVATNQDFHGFGIGDVVNQSDSNASGTVSDRNFANNQLLLAGSSGTWKTDGSTSVLGVPRFAEGTILSTQSALREIQLQPITGAWGTNSKGTTTKSGTGTIDLINVPTGIISLSVTNGEWIPTYYVAGSPRNAVEMTASLSFNSDGSDVQLERFYEPSTLMENFVTPKLYFPEEFDTNEPPDVDLPYPTYLQTFAISGNRNGNSPEVASNVLYPDYLGRSIPAARSFRYTKEEFGEFCRWACSSNYRSAIVTIQETTETINELRRKAETMAQDYIDRQS